MWRHHWAEEHTTAQTNTEPKKKPQINCDARRNAKYFISVSSETEQLILLWMKWREREREQKNVRIGRWKRTANLTFPVEHFCCLSFKYSVHWFVGFVQAQKERISLHYFLMMTSVCPFSHKIQLYPMYNITVDEIKCCILVDVFSVDVQDAVQLNCERRGVRQTEIYNSTVHDRPRRRHFDPLADSSQTVFISHFGRYLLLLQPLLAAEVQRIRCSLICIA